MKQATALVTRLILGFAAVIATTPAFAIEYPVPIDVEEEEDIYDLYYDGQIDDGELNVLITLLKYKVDVNSADREDLYQLPGLTYDQADAIIAYREANGPFKKPYDVVKVMNIEADEVEAMIIFMDAKPPAKQAPPFKGYVKLKAIENFDDDDSPSTFLFARAEALGHLVMGLGVLGQDALYDYTYHPSVDGAEGYFTSPGPSWGPSVPKVYVGGEYDVWSGVIGDYRVGFGQGLVFDSTDRYNPFGWYEDVAYYENYDTAVYGMPMTQFGLAAQMDKLSIGSVTKLSGAVFTSYKNHKLYQYDFAPHDVWEESYDPDLDTNEKYSYQSFDDLFTEFLVGGSIRIYPSWRWYVGVTGYYGKIVDWNVDEADDELYFNTSGRFPKEREGFATIGLDFGINLEDFDIFGEYARMDNGANAFLIKGLFTKKPWEVELSFRSYDQDFDNPHARAIAAADEWEGVRVADEQGGRLKIKLKPLKWLKFSMSGDVWHTDSKDQVNALFKLRGDATWKKIATFSVWSTISDKDLSEGGDDESYFDKTLASGTFYAQGGRYTVTGKIKSERWKMVTLYAQYKVFFWDVDKYDTKKAWGHYVFGKVVVKPTSYLKLTSRLKYYDEDVDAVGVGDKYLGYYLQGEWKIVPQVSLVLRYTYKRFASKGTDVVYGPDIIRVPPKDGHQLKGAVKVTF